MRFLGWNLALALVWAATLGDLSVTNLAVGFALGFLILGAGGSLVGAGDYLRKSLRLVEFVAFFATQLVLSSLRVAMDIVTPRHRGRPAIVSIPLDVQTDGEITLLANLISLTPGSLALDVSEDRQTLYVHVMFLEDVEQCREDIKRGFEDRVLGLLR